MWVLRCDTLAQPASSSSPSPSLTASYCQPLTVPVSLNVCLTACALESCDADRDTEARLREPAYLAYCGQDSPRSRGIHARRLPALGHAACVASAELFDFEPPRAYDEETLDDGWGGAQLLSLNESEANGV